VIKQFLPLPIAVPLLAQLKPGTQCSADNSNFLGATSTIVTKLGGKEYYVWDQFRSAAESFNGIRNVPVRLDHRLPVLRRVTKGQVQRQDDGGIARDSEAFPQQADSGTGRGLRSHAGSKPG